MDDRRQQDLGGRLSSVAAGPEGARPGVSSPLAQGPAGATAAPPRPGLAERFFRVPPWRLALRLLLPCGLLAAVLPSPPPAVAGGLEGELGRSEVRVWSGRFPLAVGIGVRDAGLPERLERLGYRRVSARPAAPGEYFWGHDVFWIYRRGHRWGGRDHPPALIRLGLQRETGMVEAVSVTGETALGLGTRDSRFLEPELLSEALDGRRARRAPVRLDELPEPVWRSVLAAEDHRFFDHPGVDGRAVARALLANFEKGGVAQGGSTITQQLIKNRDLTPRRSLGRKVSEAVRALALEAEYDKREILAAYLNHVYLGHVGGLAVHGFGAAARAYFGKPAQRLTAAEAAALAGMIRSPNRLSPLRHPEAARRRRDQVLEVMEQEGWLSAAAAAAAREASLRARAHAPEAPPAGSFLGWVSDLVQEEARRRVARGRGVVVETSLDPHLQRLAEEAMAAELRRLRAAHPGLRAAPIGAALVALDAETGDVLAYVGSRPGELPGGFDRARWARRQPGSVVKPLLLLEAFERCGEHGPLHPASRVADEPLELRLRRGVWRPANADGRFQGTVTLRQALEESRNVPFVRIARHCGFAATAERLRQAGLALPEMPPPSFVLGAVETTPLSLARAYTVFAAGGVSLAPRPLTRLERPGGSRLERVWVRPRRVVSPETAYLVTHVMWGAAAEGTARAAALDGLPVAAKTGTTSEARDAWLAGHARGLVTVVWVGRDDGKPLGLTGSQAAAPLWRRFMRDAVRSRPSGGFERPPGIVTRDVDSRTGLLVRRWNPHSRQEVFRRRALPPRDRFWRRDPAVEVIE
ncbi:MAG TPA: transglycosylase domain-containing protein [Thermoanaerobaculia bacterium]|nr:transglycosylase domain-containing protein [Thermoanaerobaculia bacterium]